MSSDSFNKALQIRQALPIFWSFNLRETGPEFLSERNFFSHELQEQGENIRKMSANQLALIPVCACACVGTGMYECARLWHFMCSDERLVQIDKRDLRGESRWGLGE